jgi:hypothetical protein
MSNRNHPNIDAGDGGSNAPAPAIGHNGGPSLLNDYAPEDQVAAELHVTKRTLQRWHAARIGPPRLIIARRPYYRREAVREWLRSREQGAAEPKGAKLRRVAGR